MTVAARLAATVMISAACAGQTPVGAPVPTQAPPPIVVEPEPRPPVSIPVPPPPGPEPLAPPGLAAANGWMPVHSARVPEFLETHPSFDGRGVLIAILDSGIDPSVPGLRRTSTNTVKVIDLRDMSGEGRVALEEVAIRGDSIVTLDKRVILGAGRVRALSVEGPTYAGTLRETPLGSAPAADLNGNLLVGDTLVVVVTKASDGWILLADTDGDGTLIDEVPVRDYGRAQEVFGWSTAGRPYPVGIAVNFSDEDGEAGPPRLDLVFDTSGHGTHVAGIAAGRDMYGISGFDGVAPGAELLGIKISNDARGGITVTGSILDATDYAIRSARARQQPLVINLSFGVGNEIEGTARIDVLLDSVLAANPDVVMTVSAGNDGPGLSTIGFPGSARRVVSVGGSYPGVFLPPTAQGTLRPDLIAFFSSRGGELSRPDLVAPGLAYSTVPRWNTGDEVKSGTSMASPYVAGLAANLLSGTHETARAVSAGAVRRALLRSSHPLASGSAIDQGTGSPDLPVAWDLLHAATALDAEIEVSVGGQGGDAALVIATEGATAPDRITFTVTAPRQLQGQYQLASSARYLQYPTRVTLGNQPSEIPVTIAWDSLGSEIRTAVIAARSVSGAPGDFQLVVTAGKADAFAVEHQEFAIQAGELRRFMVDADSGRPFTVSVADKRGNPLLLFLHEPGGMPSREGPVAASGGDEPEAILEVDGRTARDGRYEIIVLAGPAADAEAVLNVVPAPVRLSAVRDVRGDSLTVIVQPGGNPPSTTAGSVSLELVGAERGLVVSSNGSADVRVPFRVPRWSGRLVVEVSMDPMQWGLFTDFGLTLEGPAGEIVSASPLNYAVGRLEVDLPEALRERDVNVVLSPAFADPGAKLHWRGTMAIRLYGGGAEPEVALAAVPFILNPEGSDSLRFALPSHSWTLGDAFDPLGSLVAEVEGAMWRTEVRLAPPLPPVMP